MVRQGALIRCSSGRLRAMDSGHSLRRSQTQRGGDSTAPERAADLMDLYLAAAETDALADLGAKLPAGRLFPASGKAFVPFVKRTIYDQLLAATGTRETPTPAKAASKAPEAGASAGAGQGSSAGGAGAGDPPATRAGMKAPTKWDEIGIGSHVLACQGPMEGWFEAVILATKSPNSFVLRWRDWPEEPEIVRAGIDLGLLPVNSREGIA